MATNAANEQFEALEEYSFYNSIINNPKGSTDSIPEQIIYRSIPKETPNRAIIIDNCKKLNNYIARCTSNTSYVSNICYDIINHWLNEQVRLESVGTHKSHLDIYNKCMQEYNKLNLYVSKIYYINDILFNKKKKLYELYRKYNDLLDILGNYDSSKCVDISQLVKVYNNIIEQYPYKDNSNFCEVLTKFRSKFENEAEEYIEKCNPKILEFKSFADPPISRVHSADYSQQNSGDVDRFPSQPSENIASTFAITLFGTSLGSFLVLMLFHKITLFGYRLRNKKNINILMENNLGEETYELPLNTSEEHDRNSQYSNYNVTYQSLEN
ncbi:PIR protein [Plasmodium ovale]|uniref:PIR protein n=1 Tax=Plasmodium ovale TaxID=36330 RepID=A0A1D3JFU6_PLAOA|nr:PIR protein [Plasmodium ovale]